MNWSLSSLLHVMHVCREVNFASSSSWMYIAYKPLLIDLVYPFIGSLFRTKRGRKFWWFCFYFNLFVDDWQKGGEVFVFCLVYMHVFLPLFIKGGEVFMFMHICFVLQIGEKEFDLFYACLACLSPYICIHV